ncbi:MAG: hypothetical protein DGJ47_000119 [Rickettsiaceae bacterium]
MSIAIILVEPQMGENIGAAARSMKNFDLQDLRVVNPRDGWPNKKASQMSVGAINIIDKAKIFPDVKSAIADLDYVYATTAAARDMNKEHVLSRDLPQEKRVWKNCGIMFGRENCGLNNQEISHANKIVTIDTDIHFSSLNIAHAVAVICYELFQSKKQNREDLLPNCEKLAKKEDLEYFYSNLFDQLERNDFFKIPEKRLRISQKIRNIFERVDNLSHVELQTLRGVVKVLSKEKE